MPADAAATLTRSARAHPHDEVVRTHTPLVRRIAYHLVSRLPPNVQVDDLIQAGMIGLLEAAANYSTEHGASFETFAGIRIRGAMLDEIRKTDWTPRSLHRKLREIAEVIRDIEMLESRDARDTEVAERMNLSLEEYHRVLHDAAAHKIFSFEDLVAGGDSISAGLCSDRAGPMDQLEEDQCRQLVAASVDGLPDRERLVMSLYYDEDLNLREIGALLNVSESRVCQIHGQAVVRLRARARHWHEADPAG